MPMPQIPEDWEWSVWLTSDRVELSLLDHTGQNNTVMESRDGLPTPVVLQEMAEAILHRIKLGEQLADHLGIKVWVQ